MDFPSLSELLGYGKKAIGMQDAAETTYQPGLMDGISNIVDGFNPVTGVAPSVAIPEWLSPEPIKVAGGGAERGGLFTMDSFLGGANADGSSRMGWGMPAIGAAQTIMGAFQNAEKMNMAKKAFKENTRQFNLNYGAQRSATNTQMEDRQRARVASNSSYESVDSYMNRNRIV